MSQFVVSAVDAAEEGWSALFKSLACEYGVVTSTRLDVRVCEVWLTC